MGGLVAASAMPLGAAPDERGQVILTILDGEAQLLLGARAAAAAEGLHLPASTLVETQANTALLRLEWPDGSVLDLGPDTRLMLQPAGLRRSGQAPAYYLLSGWAKHQSGSAGPHRGHVSPQVDALPSQGVTVVQVGADQSLLYCEAGQTQLAERAGAAARHSLSAGAAYLRKGTQTGQLLPRPDPAWLKTVPRAFRDTIALRAARFEGKKLEPAARPAPSYAALAPWLTAEPALRREFPRRLATLAREPAFRAALIQNLVAHPEWEPLLFPERFLKPASAPTGVRP